MHHRPLKGFRTAAQPFLFRLLAFFGLVFEQRVAEIKSSMLFKTHFKIFQLVLDRIAQCLVLNNDGFIGISYYPVAFFIVPEFDLTCIPDLTMHSILRRSDKIIHEHLSPFVPALFQEWLHGYIRQFFYFNR